MVSYLQDWITSPRAEYGYGKHEDWTLDHFNTGREGAGTQNMSKWVKSGLLGYFEMKFFKKEEMPMKCCQGVE